MREIKFRGKRIDNGQWMYGYLQLSEDKKSAWICKSKEDDWTVKEQFPVAPETVMQYTGLKDKNGKEIYEGDILRYTYDEVTKVDVIEFKAPIFTYRNSFRWSLNRDEVIGNIYENPDLLEK